MYIMIGYIYTISSEKTDKIYIGSTIQSLNQRFSVHKCKFKTQSGGCSSKLIVCYDDCCIECIEELEVDKPKDVKLKARERYYIELYIDNVVNKQKPSRTQKEWYVDNRKHILEKQKNWREANREYILEKKKEKYTCECGSIIVSSIKARHLKTQKHINFMNLKN